MVLIPELMMVMMMMHERHVKKSGLLLMCSGWMVRSTVSKERQGSKASTRKFQNGILSQLHNRKRCLHGHTDWTFKRAARAQWQ